MLEILQNRAGLFVVVAWIFFVVSIPVCLSIGIAAGISAFYFPAHQNAPFNLFDIKACYAALGAGVFAAMASSFALAFGRRVVASGIVLVIWGAIVLGIPTARLFVKLGPKYFERHLGQEVYLVPWQYGPGGHGSTDEDPRQIGLSARLCTSSIKGGYDQDCRDWRQLYVIPKEKRNEADLDVRFWRDRITEMSTGSKREDYQPYIYNSTSPAGGPARITRYFAREDAQGQLTRLVVCGNGRREDDCTHHALAGKYWLRYDAPLTAGDRLDGEISALLESWRRK